MGDNAIQVYDDLNQALTFGKYRGQPVSVLASDKNYCDWLMAQPWFRQYHQQVYNVIVNNFTKPEDTPEHNVLQAKFLDKSFVTKIGYTLFSCDYLKKSIKGEIANWRCDLKQSIEFWGSTSESAIGSAERITQLQELLDHFDYDTCMHDYLTVMGLEFEVKGWDVVVSLGIKYKDLVILSTSVWFEIKPSIGDDFPSILRQMKSQRDRAGLSTGNIYLIYNSFNAVGVTEDQMRQIFNQSGFKVCRFAEIESVGD